MNRIHQLDDMIANKIAAGEVVERPASVIKELVENSIDASATHIHVLVEEGGSQSMTVIDDGIGMSREDALMCFRRHATSKIIDEDDLFAITSLGFRGEAIPSIASISHFKLETSDGNEATEVIYEFGERQSIRAAQVNKGTKITVERIFQNVPARLKYMRSVNAEFAAIYTYIERLALAHPEIAMTLTHDGRQIFATNGSGKLLEVIAAIYGINVARNMIPVDFGNEEFHITGYISKIDTSRASKSHIITLVNHRYIRNVKTINAINDVYRKYLPDKRYPIVVINIEVDPYLVDVNVHPAKLEVRFSKETELKEMIQEGLSKALSQVNLTYESRNRETERQIFKPSVEQMTFHLEETNQVIKEEEPVYHTDSADVIMKEKEVASTTYFPEERTMTPKVNETLPKEPVVKPIKEKIYAKGQVRGTYLIGENERGMFLFDQHAAQERINYEYFREKYADLDLTMQPMLAPLTFEYPESESLILEERKDQLTAVGIHLEQVGRGMYIVRELPLWMKNIDEKTFIDEMVQQILSHNHLDVLALRDHAIATLACKASLKANTYLALQDMQTIMDNLMRCENPYVCPHGRPTVIFYSDYELEKLFKRVMA
ncbi:MAG: DNA mismatch repair endonuclease MutL [Erysipelotrichaceae bacterium]|nr:DNA mismatch repair endonuclease MutL [Erysipelotrichaceae bacterium]